MPKAARKRDWDNEDHKIITGSPNVLTNWRPSARAAPAKSSDIDDDHVPLKEGSPNVFVNFRKFHRLGDKDMADRITITGSPNVLVNS